MEVLVCVKRVPAPGARIVLTPDGRTIDTRHLGFTVSPHEECAVEEAVRICERRGGRVTVLTLGPPEAAEQLQYAMAMGADHGVLVETGGHDWDPEATAAGITDAIRGLESDGARFDLILFGNESADAANYQVGIRVAHALGLPVVVGGKGIELTDASREDPGGAPGHSGLRVRREIPDGYEVYELALPAVVSVKEGINLPRYPTVMGRMKAKKVQLTRFAPERREGGLALLGLRHSPQQDTHTVMLGDGADAAPAVVGVFEELGLL